MSDQPLAPALLRREDAPPVPVTGNCALGRAIANDIVLVDDRVSRRHATIHTQGEGEYWLVDLGSRNGTYLNERRVSQPTRLRAGDRIQVGPFKLTFELASRLDPVAKGATAADQTQADLRSLPCWLLLADIIGSTALTRSLNGEELAVLVGGWFGRCNEVVEDTGGTINKYLGDGFFAYWPVREGTLPLVAQALRDLRRLQDRANPGFRMVVHLGRVLLGGMPSSGEENLAGPEVTFLFRQETLARQLNVPRLASASAAQALQPLVELQAAGDHALPGFDGKFRFSTF